MSRKSTSFVSVYADACFDCRPIGIVAGAVNKAGQSAKEIVEEMVQETVVALKGAGSLLNAGAKL